MSRHALIALEAGRFTAFESGGGVHEIDLAAALALLQPAASMRTALAGPTGDSLPRWEHVVGDAAVIAEVRGAWAETYVDVDERWVRLGAWHLRVLAAVTDELRVIDLSKLVAIDLADLDLLVEDLRSIGLLKAWGARIPPSETTAQDRDVPSRGRLRAIASRVSGRSRGAVAPPRIDAPPEAKPPAQEIRDEVDVREEAARSHVRPPADRTPLDPDRIPVLSFWATSEGPHQGSAAVVAYARVHHDGALNVTYDLRRVHPAREVLAEIAAHDGPVVLLSSDYIWSLDANLEVAAAALASNPRTVVIHGGPCAPRYDDDCDRFLRQLPLQHVVVPGEGEITLAEALTALASTWRGGSSPLDMRALQGVAGLRFRHPDTGEVVRGTDRARHADLADFPSPFVSGEFDDVDDEVLAAQLFSVESNRGCPYGCTFCDWGQNTMARIRKFPLERVFGEFAWLADRQLPRWMIADANFSILPRDTEIVDEIIRVRQTRGVPEWLSATPPKNSTKRLVEIADALLGAGISMKMALALQTRDEATLDAVRRTNIGTAAYDELAVDLRRRGLPLTCDLMLGMPGATVESFKTDLQWCLDHHVRPQINRTVVLPNAPMNDPDYLAEWEIETEDTVIVSTSTFSRADHQEMLRLAYVFVLCEILGHLRHVLRYLQWDHGRRAIEVVHDLLRLVEAAPDRYPLLDWAFHNTDLFLLPPLGWGPFYDEVADALVGGLGITDDAGLRTAIAVNRFVMPYRGRTYPETVELDHDYVAYFEESAAALRSTGIASSPTRPLATYGPGQLTVWADPDLLGEAQMRSYPDAREGMVVSEDFFFVTHLEVISPLLVYLPMTSPDFLALARERLVHTADEEHATDATPVVLGARRTLAS